MLSEPRAILFQTELLLPPIPQLKIDHQKVRKLYNHLYDSVGHRYENIELRGAAPTLSTKRGDEVVSTCKFETYSVTISERNPEFATADEFVSILRRVLGGLGELAPVFSQRCRIQCISQPSIPAIPLLAGEVANVFEKIGPFERPPAQFGIRFRFPPGIEEPDEDAAGEVAEEGGDETKTQEEADDTPGPREPIQYRGDVILRIETYGREARQLWMEAAVTHFFDQPVSIPDDMAEVEENVTETYLFLTDKSKKFLDQFDRPKNEDGGGS